MCRDHWWRAFHQAVVVDGARSVLSGNSSRLSRWAAKLARVKVGFADLTKGERIAPTLEAHLRASIRFKGVRQCSVWDADQTIKATPTAFPRGLLTDNRFAEGFGFLAHYGLSFDSWIYHTQIPELTNLARRFPNTTIVLDHIGGPLAIGVYSNERVEVFAKWRANLSELSACPNTFVKLGGVGMHLFGFGFEDRPTPPSSQDLGRCLETICRHLRGNIWSE
jgi:L-fuconolactonase